MSTSTFNPSTQGRRKEGEQHLDKAKEAGGQALDKAKVAGSEVVGTAKEMGAEAYDKVKDAGAAAIGKAKDAAGTVGEMATQAASAVGQKADDLTGAAGHEIKAFGDTLAQKMPQEGMAGHASQAVAETIKGAGKYVEDAKLSGLARDLEQVFKTHPLPAALICIGIGFFVGRAMKD